MAPTLRFPPPSNYDDFDSLVRQIAERKFGVEATRYGRNGQAQHGVDIALTDAHGRLVAIQSKHTQALTASMMDAEMDKLVGATVPPSPGFPQRVDHFIFATSATRDTKHTDHALDLEKIHKPIRVTVWPWEHLNDLLNSMPSLAATYCAAILTPEPLENVREKHAHFVHRALNRPALLDTFRFEGNFAEQRDGLRDLVGFLSTGNLYDRNRTLVYSILPYTETDKYGSDVEKLKRAILVLVRLIEKNMTELQTYATCRGTPVEDLDPKLVKVYLDFEDKRRRIVTLANELLTEFSLTALQEY